MHTPQVSTAAAAIHRTAVSRGTISPTMTSSTPTPAEPSQKTVVTSQLIAAGGGCTACTMLSSAAELARMTGMDTATTMTASPSRNVSDARRLVVPPPPGPQHRRAQPLRQLVVCSRSTLACRCSHQALPARSDPIPSAATVGAARRLLS